VLLAQTPLQVCVNQGYALTSVSAADGVGTITYKWYESTNGGAMTEISGSASSLSKPEGKGTPGTYTYVRKATSASCSDVASNTFTVVVNAVPSVTLSSATGSNNQTVNSGTAITPIKYTASNATTIYLTGTLPANVGSSVTSNTTLNIYGTPSAAGTFNYSVSSSHTNGCVSAVASGTLRVEGPPGTVTTTLCTACCHNGSAWVNCYVTTNAYPFDNNSTNTSVVWSGNGTNYYSGARSDRNGRANTAVISSTGTSAVQICKDLGEGWYLPAYEELLNMSTGALNSPLNGKSGANLLASGGHHWSSTELYNNGGRYDFSDTYYQSYANMIRYDGELNGGLKTFPRNVRCAWRN
jgi:hypothetical protein